VARRELLALILLAACAGGALAQAGKPEAVPGKAVIYLLRSDPDAYQKPAEVYLNDGKPVALYLGHHVRWVVAPGTHRIQCAAPDTGRLTLRVEAGKIYFVRQDVAGITAPMSTLRLISDREGREALQRSKRVDSR